MVVVAPRGERAGECQGRVDYHHNHNHNHHLWSRGWGQWEKVVAVLLEPRISSSRLAQGNPSWGGDMHRAKWSPQ